MVLAVFSGQPSVAAVPSTPLIIGGIADLTGQAGVYGQPSINAWKLAVSDINAAGGVWGKPVKLVTGDGASSPQQTLSEAQRLVNIERAQAIILSGGSGVCLAVKQGVTVPLHILTIGALCVSPVHTADQHNKQGFFFRIRPSIKGLIDPIAKTMAVDGITRACVMYVDNAYGQGGKDEFLKVFPAFKPGADIQAVAIPDAVGTTYLAELQKCTANGHDTVVALAYPDGQADVFVKEALENHLAKKIYFDEDQESVEFFNKVGWAPYDSMKGFSGDALPGPGQELFRSEYRKAYGSLPSIPLTEGNYDGAVLVALAAAKAQSAKSSDIRDQMYAVANSPGTAVGPGPTDLKNAFNLIAQGKKIKYTGATDNIEFDDQGQEVVAAAKMWHVDAANKQVPVDGFAKGVQGVFKFFPSPGCKYCNPFGG
jgi:branched-chain amino acid transport system substrate-binding protein